MELYLRLIEARKAKGFTQQDVAEHCYVSTQAVSQWEHGDAIPDVTRLADVAKLYGVTTDWLLGNGTPEEVKRVKETMSERLFQEDHMYTQVKAYAASKGFLDTMKALPFAREKHAGQYRKGGEKVPYIYHPLLLACHAISLGIANDALLSACLLHDVMEDCGVTEDELPVSEEAREAIRLLTKPKGFTKTPEAEEAYYGAIEKNPIASVVKILDRCNNISSMAATFDAKHLATYIIETEEYIAPLIKHTENNFPEYYYPLFSIKYHMNSVLETIKHQLQA